MQQKKKILVLSGSAGSHTSNSYLIKHLQLLSAATMDFILWEDLSVLPHFNTQEAVSDTPAVITRFRLAIQNADGLLICTPEYIFSIPARLKNALEWCVAVTVLSDKPVGLITAAANGQRGHAELQLIMKTLQTIFTPDTCLLIPGVKSKFNNDGSLNDSTTQTALEGFLASFQQLVADPQAALRQ